ncbi:uncharacterized protein A4U43_C03F16620 [Asparagus officinalis]|uniref:Uncharacterized protein n=1 Tax=Asparagus officinalis TaxID=4686 RepID=A0A5P1FAK8_ASPOF|nr:uncharacterized protein LOC109833848 isoform X1 [Asparagus officinalis]ONK75416.1 uncharacterized protein A4U43_C03F16620 [Asparagus officinalis]
MFSIAAINDPESCGQWEPLAPTKEAQEFHLSQTYHDGLLKLQAKDYAKARELLEAVLKDPIISSSQVGKDTSDGHLLQLRFLTLKNLATVFLEQGPAYYKNALQCYIQAVEIDANDSVVWNKLGTLSCTMGLLSTSRWAFEQGLLCSPNNWNCMEKLLEILIAIGDEVACLSVAELILRHWPSHSRALFVKKTIENAEPEPFAPRGVDKLEPKHIRLKFPDKRNAEYADSDENTATKKHKTSLELKLAGATWEALADGILSIFHSTSEKESKSGFSHNDALDENSDDGQGKVIHYEKIGKYSNVRIDLCLSNSEIAVDSIERKLQASPIGEKTSLSYTCDETSTSREKESCEDKEHPQERRSTRLERLRSRKSGKEELEFSNTKDLGEVVFRFLEPFVCNRPRQNDHDNPDDSSGLSAECIKYSAALEHNDVSQFLSKASKNFGAYHIGHLLLEEVSHISIPFQDSFVKFLELEKLTRHWGQDRTPVCSLFIAELYYDRGSLSANESERSELFSEASYHLAKVIEKVALDSSKDLTGLCDLVGSSKTASEENNSDNMKLVSCVVETISVGKAMTEDSSCQEFRKQDAFSTNDTAFWVRFFWLSGHLSLYSGGKDKAFREFCVCLSLLANSKTVKGTPDSVFLPHCKLVRLLTISIIRYEINLLNLDALLGMSIKEMIEKGMYAKCKDVLSPLLLSNKNFYLEILSNAPKESERVIAIELSALDCLMTTCEKTEPVDIDAYLNCHRRKLQILTVAAGIVDPLTSEKDRSSIDKATVASDLDNVENTRKKWIHMVAEEVKDISRVATQVKNIIDQRKGHSDSNFVDSIISEIQTLLLAVMCYAVRKIISLKGSCSGSSNHVDQLDGWCLVDAGVAFCKLQHLDPSVPIKTQADLIVAVHDLLAEYGLCCAGRDNKGEEGIFLKLAIKHLLALDMKLKSLTGGVNGKEENASHKDGSEGMTPERVITCEEQDKDVEGLESKKNVVDAKSNSYTEPNEKYINPDTISLVGDEDIEDVELQIDNALGQSFFCLYGLNINPDSSSEDDLAVHKNTSRGDYQTKEQSADVFQYILPYARSLSRAGLIKLRRVLKAIRKHFPQPPDEVLAENAIDNILDCPDLSEDKLSEVSRSDGNWDSIMNHLFPNGSGALTYKTLSAVGSQPYFEVYGNLYYLIAQADETSATDKYAGFVLRKEGEEFVEQSANLFKYDLLYNPLHFESWQKLANIYDEEVDLLLNDGSKHVNIVDWRKNTTLPQRVETGRRRSRRCLLMSLALAKTPVQQSQIHELLAQVYYDSLQNVVPFYDQRSTIPTKNEAWMAFSQNSMKHFEKAFALKPEWWHAFYLGKLCEKLEYSPDKAFSYYNNAASLNPSAVDPVYRMHASRLKLLYTRGKQNLNILQIVAVYCFNKSTKETVMEKLGCTSLDLMEVDVKDVRLSDDSKMKMGTDTQLVDDVWHILYDDCLSALEVCVEGELKHYHKARYMLGQGLYKRGEFGDLERAKDELSFCFKSSRSSFTINMWEIDGAKRARRKNPGHGGNKKTLEVSLSESSRKFITCIRKYILLYLTLLEKTGDLCTLERAYVYLRTDKRFYLCLGDIVPVGLGKYVQVLTSSIRKVQNTGATDSASLEPMLERMFNIFMDHANLWADISSLPEVNNPDLSESNLYAYIHQYIHLLESDTRLEALEGINEKIRKRFKNPKLSNSNIAKICRHASLAWCRCILIKLSAITPLPDSECPSDQSGHVETGLQLFVDLQPDEFLSSSTEGPYSRGLDLNLYQTLSRLKNVRIQQALEENLEAAATLLRCTYNYYRDSSCGAVPSGINLYTVFFPSHPSVEGLQQVDQDRIDVLDLSIPRKLLLWVYTLVHGRYSSISAVVKYCEEHAKSRMKRGAMTSPSVCQPVVSISVAHAGAVKERSDRDEYSEADEQPSATAVVSASPHQEDIAPTSSVLALCAPQLQRCNNNKGE